MHCAAMFPHRAISEPCGVMHGSTHTGQCCLGAALSCMAFYFWPSLFLSTTSKVKYCPCILLTEPERKSTGGDKTRRGERERPGRTAEQAPLPRSLVPLNNIRTWDWALDWPLKRHRDSWKSDCLQISEKESFMCIHMQFIVLIKSLGIIQKNPLFRSRLGCMFLLACLLESF